MQSGTKGIALILFLAVALIGLAAADQWTQRKGSPDENAVEVSSGENAAADVPGGEESSTPGDSKSEAKQPESNEVNPNVYYPM